MSEGPNALIGIVIGGLITGIAQAVRYLLAKRRASRLAARAIWSELLTVASGVSALAEVRDRPEWNALPSEKRALAPASCRSDHLPEHHDGHHRTDRDEHPPSRHAPHHRSERGMAEKREPPNPVSAEPSPPQVNIERGLKGEGWRRGDRRQSAGRASRTDDRPWHERAGHMAREQRGHTAGDAVA
jgi:hypothetical protein